MKSLRKLFITIALGAAFGFAANAFVIENGRVAPAQSQSAGANFKFDQRLSAARIDFAAEKGSKYAKWTLKRIVLTAPADIAGNVKFHVTRNDIMLVPDAGLSKSIRLDVLNAAKAGIKPVAYNITVYPAALGAGTLTLEYYLTDGKDIEVLSHKVKITDPVFVAGKSSVFAETVPADPQAEGWSVKPFVRDVEAIRAQVLSVAKRADVASMQVAYTDNLGDVALTVTNSDWFNAKDARKPWFREFDNSDIYQAAEAGAMPFVYVVMKLVENGTLDLDEPLYKIYPEILDHFSKGSKNKAKNITVRQCLQHISCIKNGNDEVNIDNFPGSTYGESRNNYRVLQWVVEEITGKSVEDLCSKQIFKPLKLTSTSYKWQPLYKEKAVPGYGGTDSPSNRPDWGDRGWVEPGTSLRTTATEYSAFLKWALAGGGLKPETVASMFESKVHVPAPEYRREKMNMWRGLGWTVENNAELGTIAMHSGRNAQWRCTAMILPERGETFCVFTNTANRINYYDALMDIFFATKEPVSCFGCGYLYPLDDRK